MNGYYVAIYILALVHCSYPLDIYVNHQNTSGSETGSLQQPFNTIQESVNTAAEAGDIIHVAQGVYTENVRIEGKAIQLLGGYDSAFNNRNPETNVTTIQGDGSNAAISLVSAGESIVDGFRITGGTGNTDNLPWSYFGGGVYCFEGAPSIINNLIEGNDMRHADVGIDSIFGGGIAVEDSNAKILNNRIRNNLAGRGGGISVRGGIVTIQGNAIQGNIGFSDHGGGLYIASPSAEISNNLIEDNEVGRELGYGWGGGIIVFNPNNFAQIRANTIRQNYAPSMGAGVFIDEGAQAVLDHTLIYKNKCDPGSSIGGLGVYLDSGEFDGMIIGASATITHCTIVDNLCESTAGGNGLMATSQSNAIVRNSIFWGNGGDDFLTDETSTIQVSYSCSEESIPGIGNISSDPLFTDPANNDYHLRSTVGTWDPNANGGAGNWRVYSTQSPCIDAGDPQSEFSHEPEPNGSRVNMGAYGNTAEASLAGQAQKPTPTGSIQPTATQTLTLAVTPSPTGTPVLIPSPSHTPILTSQSGFSLVREFSFQQSNEFTAIPGGFANQPAGTHAVGSIPTDNQELSDGTGVTITTAPGQVELLFFPSIEIGDRVALMRASVRSTGSGAAIALAAVDSSLDGSIATNIPANSNIYLDRFSRMVIVYDPPGTAFHPVFQLANLTGSQEVTVFLDNVEIYALHKDGSIPNGIFYGGSIVLNPDATPTPTRASTPFATVTLSPTPTNTPDPDSRRIQMTGIGGGGALYSASMSPFNPQEIYMATDMSGVFHTLNFGRSWEMLDFRQLQGGVNSNVRFTSDPNILYSLNLSDDLRILSKSIDGGQTWIPLPNDPTEAESNFLFADPHSTQRLLIGNWNTLFYSTDGGNSFEQVYRTNHIGGLLLGGVFWDGDLIVVSTLDGLLVSVDGGQQFAIQPVGGLPDDELIVSMAGAKEGNAIRLFAVTHGPNVWADMQASENWDSKSVYRLNWGDNTWSKMNNGFSECDRPFFVSMALNDIDTAYVAGGNVYPCMGVPIVYKTVNGGDSWENVFLTDNNQNIVTGWMGDGGDLDWSWAETALGFAVSPIDANRAIVTDFGFAHVTEDGGVTWRQAYVDPEYENPAGVSISRGKAYATNGVQNTSCWWIHWTSGNTVLTAFTDIQGIRGVDNGQSWTAGSSLGLPHNSTYQFIEHSITHTLYGCTSSVHDLYQSTYLRDRDIDNGEGTIVFSNDRGQTWDILYDFGHPVIWMAVDEANDSMYASVVHGSDGGIFFTRNLSAGTNSTWQKLSDPPRTAGHPFTIHVLNNGDLLASYSGKRDENGAFTETSGVFLLRDGETDWVDVSHPNMLRWTKDVVVDPHDTSQNTWYACVFSHWGTSFNEVGGIYRTIDRGGSWTRISDLYRVESVAIHPDNPDIMFASTETQGLWMTNTLRSPNPTLKPVDGYPFRHPTRMFFEPDHHNRLWTTSFGGGIIIIDISD